MNSIALAVRATDPVTRQGAVACLATYPQVVVLAPDQDHQYEVLLMLATEVTDATVAAMRLEARGRGSLAPPVVLVADEINESRLLQAIGFGLVSFVSRPDADFDRIVAAITTAQTGCAGLPTVVLRSLIHQIAARPGSANTREAGHPIGAHLTTREIDVLTLLAEGMDTSEIATELNYSERTVKSVIHQALTRLQLRNRTHAVAYALRSRAI